MPVGHNVQAALVLEDGSTFVGEPFGALVPAHGEVVFNTGMTGYLEVCTDPSYRGQMVVMTHPQIGNYGVAVDEAESTVPWLAGLLVRDYEPAFHHWKAELSLGEYLARHNVPGLQGVDTRAVTRRLRAAGTMRGILGLSRGSTFTGEELRLLAEKPLCLPSISERAVVQEVSGAAAEAAGTSWDGTLGPNPVRIVLVDCGAKLNIGRSLARRGALVEVAPWDSSAQEVLALKPGGVVISNGPGDPATLGPTIELVAGLLLAETPLLGICLGHQILALAVGARTGRLKFGHHGANHPVKDLVTGRVHITTQNHEFQVLADSLPPESGLYVSHINLNDGSVEGLAHRSLPVFSVQFHPEGSPGPQDNQYLFDRFFALVRRHRRKVAEALGGRVV